MGSAKDPPLTNPPVRLGTKLPGRGSLLIFHSPTGSRPSSLHPRPARSFDKPKHCANWYIRARTLGLLTNGCSNHPRNAGAAKTASSIKADRMIDRRHTLYSRWLTWAAAKLCSSSSFVLLLDRRIRVLTTVPTLALVPGPWTLDQTRCPYRHMPSKTLVLSQRRAPQKIIGNIDVCGLSTICEV